MKDIFCVAAFAGKVLCLMVFVTVLKPDGSIGAIRASTKSVDCRMGRSGMQECGLNVVAAISQAGARPCIARPSVAHC
jgi:hypothetical protein